jgi:hypothetical protein
LKPYWELHFHLQDLLDGFIAQGARLQMEGLADQGGIAFLAIPEFLLDACANLQT